MITHKVSVMVQREVNEQFASSPIIPPRRAVAVNRWEILIAGDIGSDDPAAALPLLRELQDQVETIRTAYAAKGQEEKRT